MGISITLPPRGDRGFLQRLLVSDIPLCPFFAPGPSCTFEPLYMDISQYLQTHLVLLKVKQFENIIEHLRKLLGKVLVQLHHLVIANDAYSCLDSAIAYQSAKRANCLPLVLCPHMHYCAKHNLMCTLQTSNSECCRSLQSRKIAAGFDYLVACMPTRQIRAVQRLL